MVMSSNLISMVSSSNPIGILFLPAVLLWLWNSWTKPQPLVGYEGAKDQCQCMVQYSKVNWQLLSIHLLLFKTLTVPRTAICLIKTCAGGQFTWHSTISRIKIHQTYQIRATMSQEMFVKPDKYQLVKL